MVKYFATKYKCPIRLEFQRIDLLQFNLKYKGKLDYFIDKQNNEWVMNDYIHGAIDSWRKCSYSSPKRRNHLIPHSRLYNLSFGLLWTISKFNLLNKKLTMPYVRTHSHYLPFQYEKIYFRSILTPMLICVHEWNLYITWKIHKVLGNFLK